MTARQGNNGTRPGRRMIAIADQMEDFEASGSIPKTGTGSRREGKRFEHLARDFWTEMYKQLKDQGGISVELFRSNSKSWNWSRIEYSTRASTRAIYLPVSSNFVSSSDLGEYREEKPEWLNRSFVVSELVKKFPGEAEAIARYAPDTGRFSGNHYPQMYDGMRSMRTDFDDTIVLEEAGVLFEKFLIEYKSAKSSDQSKTDGNVHERLSFQMMQYLEAATRYTKCSFAVITNGAFIRYRNKYHVNFHIQADRLSNFKWFSMRYMSSAQEYLEFAERLMIWLFTGRRTNP